MSPLSFLFLASLASRSMCESLRSERVEVRSVKKEHCWVRNVHALVSTEMREAVNSVSSGRPVFSGFGGGAARWRSGWRSLPHRKKVLGS